MIASIKTVAVYVSDQKEALRFYTKKLGFEVRRTESMGPDGTWVEVGPPRRGVARCPLSAHPDEGLGIPQALNHVRLRRHRSNLSRTVATRREVHASAEEDALRNLRSIR
jgi:catechol 2,3-dioxygenase-like lactoylglutathione lyase family enzyme